MDQSAVKAIVERDLESLKRRLGVPHWNITVAYDSVPDRPDGFMQAGCCNLKTDYNRAAININPQALDSEDDVLGVLRHELYHIVISPFTTYSEAVDGVVMADNDRTAHAALERIWRHAMEKTIINLGRMYCGLTGKAETEA